MRPFFALALLAAPLPALAGAPAWYHPDAVAAQSATFQAAAEELGPRYQAVEDELRRLSDPIEDLDLATALAGDALPGPVRAYALALRVGALQARTAAQGHVDMVQDAYARVFGEALQRALGEVAGGTTPTECRGGAGGMAAMMGGGRPCVGEDLNPALARAIDHDTRLVQQVAEINARPWPVIDVQGQAQPPLALTGDGAWFDLATVAQALWPARLEARSDALDRALAPLDDALVGGDEAALASAREHRARYDDALAADGQVLLALATAALEKAEKRGGADVGACVNPAALGGCTGEDRTDEILALLQADRRVRKGLDALPL